MNCKHCKSENTIKYGKSNGHQIYLCKDCHTRFKDDESLPHMKVPAKLVTSALNMYYEGMSIKAIARTLKQEHEIEPSTATIYEWIQKYTQYALDSIKDYKPNPENIGDRWISDETVIEVDGNNVWLWDIIDDKTRFLLATRVTGSRKTVDAQLLIDKAIKTAGKEPKYVVTDSLSAYLDVSYGKDGEHLQAGIARGDDNTQKIERWHSTLKMRTKTMRGLKNIDSAIEFIDGFLVHYNYLRPHRALDGMTPAQAAGIDYPYKNWKEIIHNYKPSKHISREHKPRGSLRLQNIEFGRMHNKKRRQRQTKKVSQTTSVGITKGR